MVCADALLCSLLSWCGMFGERAWYGRRPQVPIILIAVLTALLHCDFVTGVILTPPYFNLAEGRKITATATCGEDTEGPELYCKLVGTNAEHEEHVNLIQGQFCDYCDSSRPEKMHPPDFAVDGMETWWQSPPLSRGMKYNEVNLTIDLGQEFHVAYVFLRMGNSPRPGLWVLEKSSDYGKTYTPWQYFSDSTADCETYFGKESLEPITRDDSVICSTEYSKIVPLEGGEIPISLLNNRPSANMYFNSSVLQEWTRATNIRLRLLRTKNLLGHLMSVARQDPTVTRRYFYSIKDISIGGRCMCNGHADTCDIQDPENPQKLLCRCQHNTCGPQCATCCPGFEQKAWRISKAYKKFECEPCNCFNHTTECKYDPEVDAQQLSLDIHGKYEGGGVCQNCQHNTEGINCNRCKPTFYKPFDKQWFDLDVCQPCKCDYFYSTGNCAEGTGQCECRPEFVPPNCDACSYGYFGYPNCRPCECNLNGTDGYHCELTGGQCPCKPNYAGTYCNQCADTYYKFPDCLPCTCNNIGSVSDSCNQETGNCTCKSSYRGRTCDQCEHGYYNYPTCAYCNCDERGTRQGICDKATGQCLCKEGYGGSRCDQCIPGYYGYPDCKPCNCSEMGSASGVCDATGKCPCLFSFAGRACDQCSPGYYQYPACLNCNCDPYGSIGISCDNDGKCQCRHNFDNNRCNQCKEGFYNYPNCEECNCNPAGVVAGFAGCGSVPAGELCLCKERVHGRICDVCRPLYWNLQPANPEGCEHCDCYLPGVVGGIGVCDTNNGQCVCKPSVTSRQCNECAPGTYDLQENDLFGCKDCDCDIGGSISSVCNKKTGQCQCQSRITGRTCREPLQAHYFPTLYQFQYEVEEGHTPERTPVRYGFDESIFPHYSWKGYAVFSFLQNEIIQNVYIMKSTLYRMVLSYVNPNPEPVTGTITIIPDNPSDNEQKFEVQFKPARNPTFVTVGGPPMVMNPGRWAVSIKNRKSLFLDYFVLLPAAFYEATILAQKVESACHVGQKGLCRHYTYPNISHFDVVHGEGGFISVDDNRQSLSEYFTDDEHLDALGETVITMLNVDQTEVHLDLTVTKPGRHVLVVTYVTPRTEEQKTQVVTVHSSSQKDIDHGLATLPSCPYTMLCRQAVTDRHHRIAVFNFDTNYISLILKGDSDTKVGIKSVVAIPEDQWSLDYIRPKSVCVRKDGKCVSAKFPIAPDSKKVKFEQGNEEQISQIRPPNIYDNSSNLIYLDHKDAMVDIKSKVPHPGYYVFVVHYYQPHFPEFDMDVLIQNGQFYEAKLPVEHCPSNSGCRAVIVQEDGNMRFALTENFMLTLKEPNHKSVWLEYLLVVPFDLYTDQILSEETFDHTGEFISTCGNNHFHINTSAEGFCRDAVFSLTADYNNGALPCDCDYEGSLSFECNKFGGQCQCKQNVIGRRCEVCKTGYYGFPDCQPCNCPSTALCETATGQCICPPRVTGEKCDECIPYTYGFDQIIGCEECNCHPLGILNDLQCDLFNGSCTCKPNIVGRTCDHCLAGYYAFPYCERCRCDLRGTTLEICDPNNALCYCKQYVEGAECDLCVEGTFNLQENNEDGCTKCFCFGKTTRCSSSSYYWTDVSGMKNWTLYSISEGSSINVTKTDLTVAQLNSSTIGLDLTQTDADEQIIYFAAPTQYLGNKLTSYGGQLNYSIFYTNSDGGGGAVSGADVILYGAGMYLLHDAIEQPAAKIDYYASVELVETNFVLESSLPANREHIMTVLEDLEAIYIRATYWQSSMTTRLGEVSMDVAVPEYRKGAMTATSVEQCQCPPGYRGLSCEECAPGYYRVETGPHGGYCVECQCNNHADTCDVQTGICIDCKHNTYGDHCEVCSVGYHGNALQGTPMDCLICACPLPIASNNFATGCEVSASGEEISCDCIPGYYGARCQSCAAGFYGQPELPDDYCKPCECSGNINPDEPDSCDSISGSCLRCLNNTFGEACALCAPGYFGDAVVHKDCQTCICDETGTKRCDSYTGTCECLPNVVGEKCDRCERDHYGFTSGEGCLPCNCQEASESAQCDDMTGQCRCRKGVTGRMCERCAPGFWDYTPAGCKSCGCNTEYSLGFGCNAQTGQCECLPGVIGEKCDHCPYRWVLILNQGCFECDTCIHDLLDVTDDLRNLIDPVINEFEAIASGYFTTQKLVYLNNTMRELQPQVAQLDLHEADILQPILARLLPAEQEVKGLNRRANFSVQNSMRVAPDAGALRQQALEALDMARDAAFLADQKVFDIENLRFDNGNVQKIDQTVAEAQYVVDDINKYNFTDKEIEALEQLGKAKELIQDMEEYWYANGNQTENWKRIKKDMNVFIDKIEDLKNRTELTNINIADVRLLNGKNKAAVVESKLDTVEEQFGDSEANLLEAHEYITNATRLLADAHRTMNKLTDDMEFFEEKMQEFNETLITPKDQEELSNLVNQAIIHSEHLSNQAQFLDHILSDTRNISENAVAAANAYKNIVNATDMARAAAEAALAASDAANDLLDGLEDKSIESARNASELLEEANRVLFHAQTELAPQMELAGDVIQDIKLANNRSESDYKKIVDALNRLGDQNYADISEQAIDTSENADELAQGALGTISSIASSVKNDLELAKQLPKDIDDTRRDMQQAQTQLGTVDAVLPNITSLIEELGPQQDTLQNSLNDIEEKIKKLNKQIELAREYANRIKVGVDFLPNTTLELRNPPNLGDQSTSTHLSTFFKTTKPNGFLLYLGNEKGTKLRRTKSDDFLALEIQNGYPKLTIDVGNGPEPIIVFDKYVADGKWYQAVVDRVGHNVKLTIREELDDGQIVEHSREEILSGPFSIFNLDQEQSRLFVGGYPASFAMQDQVQFSGFEGQMEELVIGEQQVGLWNFIDGEQNDKAAEVRDKLLNVHPSTGYRFNGNGYAILDARPHSLRSRTIIRLSFKTSAPTGLMFLAGKDDTFMSIEMHDGHVLFQYDLGNGLVSIISEEEYNDGTWHTVEASRDGVSGSLMVDQNTPYQDKADGPSKSIQMTDIMFFGGYPNMHPFTPVTNIDFDGCIDNVEILSTPVDLSLNIKAYGVMPACPAKFASLVSFSKATPGYIRQPNVSSENSFKVTLKFKTETPNGLIFYATDREQHSGISLSLVNRTLVLISQRMELHTDDQSKYDDNEWHVVTVTHNSEELRMDVDDWELVSTDAPPIALHIMYGDMYIGGVPHNYQVSKGAVKTTKPFIGCIGDATINDMIVNFANSTDKHGDILGRCILDKPADKDDDADLHTIPTLIKHGDKPVTSPPIVETTEEPFDDAWFPRWNPVEGFIPVKVSSPRVRDVSGILRRTNRVVFVILHQGYFVERTQLCSFYEAALMKSLTRGDEKLAVMKPTTRFQSGNQADINISRGNLRFRLPFDIPKRGDGGKDVEEEEQTEGPPILHRTTTVPPLFPDQEIETTTQKVTIPPEIVTTEETSVEHSTGAVTEPQEPEQPVETTLAPQRITTVASPADSCALPLEPVEEVSYKAGYRFGTQVGSRVEYDTSRGRYKNKFTFSIDFKSTSPDGLIMYVADDQHSHFVSLYLHKGKIFYIFNCGTGSAQLETDHTYNDGLWHSVTFSRNQTDGKLFVDDKLIASGQSAGNSKNLNISPPYYLGGVPADIAKEVNANLRTYEPFVGCLRNFLMNDKPMENPKITGASSCSDNIESGIFFGAKGGYMKIMERFKVGTEIDIQMDIKPRNITGLLMSVHGKKDFLVLQMVNGVIKFTVDNGKGPIEASFKPQTKHYFCDGNWHSIQAIKSKNVVSLSVDKTFADAKMGMSHSTDTRYGLFLGGHQHLHTKRIRGIQARSSFVGCIKNVSLNNELVDIKPEMASGDVNVGVCPTT